MIPKGDIGVLTGLIRKLAASDRAVMCVAAPSKSHTWCRAEVSREVATPQTEIYFHFLGILRAFKGRITYLKSCRRWRESLVISLAVAVADAHVRGFVAKLVQDAGLVLWDIFALNQARALGDAILMINLLVSSACFSATTDAEALATPQVVPGSPHRADFTLLDMPEAAASKTPKTLRNNGRIIRA